MLLKGLAYGSLWSPDCASQLEISQQSSVCSVLCDLSAPAVPSAWDGTLF